MLTVKQNKKSKGPVCRAAGVQGGEGGPCSLQLSGWPALGKRLVLTSDLPALSQCVCSGWGPTQGDAVWGAAISGEFSFHGVITLRKGFYFKSQGQELEKRLPLQHVIPQVVSRDVGAGLLHQFPPLKTATDCKLFEGKIQSLPHWLCP